MFPVLLMLTSTLSTEVSSSMGKQLVRQRRENVYDLAFLGIFWGTVIMIITLAFGAEFRVTLASLPTLLARIVLEFGLLIAIAEATIRADRSTVGFIRLITIPLMLVVDIALGYHISSLQFMGIAVMFVALVVAFRHNPISRRGAWAALLSGLIGVGTVTLYKYNITHFNSVAGEQITVLVVVCIGLHILSYRRSRRSPLQLLFRPATSTQALADGVAIPLESFAYSLAPASLIMAYKRSFALIWSIVFGGTRFHEHSIRRKVSAAVLMAGALVLLSVK